MTTTGNLQVTTFAEAQEVLAANLAAYTRRPRQEELAKTIEQAADNGDKLLAQAGTGIGKSLAALIPGIIWAKRTGHRVVVATSTRALQRQYAEKDLPFLQQHLGIDFTWAVIKGRSNYACRARMHNVFNPTRGQEAIINLLSAEHPIIGDRDDLPVVRDSEWNSLSMGTGECPGKSDCPFAETEMNDIKVPLCHAERAKAKAKEADIVITNTAYLITDIKLRKDSDGKVNLLGNYGLLIIDEAHNLESAVTSALSDTFGKNGILRLVSEAEGYLRLMNGAEEASGPADAAVVAAEKLWQVLTAHFEDAVLKHDGKRDPVELSKAHFVRDFREEIVTLGENLVILHDLIRLTDPQEREEKFAQKRLMTRTVNCVGRLRDLIMAKDIDMCKWLEEVRDTYKNQPRIRLMMRCAPVSAAPFLQQSVWNGPPTIMMSATLAIGVSRQTGQADFSFVEQCLGLRPGEAVTFDAGSPFEYQRQARVFIPGADVPAPTGASLQAWRSWAQEATQYLVTKAAGGALLLYTSRTGMEDAYRRLAPAFEEQGLLVLKQRDALPAQLIKQFKANGNAVLFGLRTFMEGIDVQGPALRLVVLDKLPFAVPTDILNKARCSRLDTLAGRRVSFYRLTVPEMSLVLIQAFGRLIRHIDDKGVVAILDPRLVAKTYGRSIVESLPPAPVTHDVKQAAAFLVG